MKEKKVKRGEIYLYDFGINAGSVQSGCRPVLVIQSDDFNACSPTTVIAAITTATKKLYLPSHIFLGMEYGLSQPSMVMLEQSRTVNQSELTTFIGNIKDEQVLRLISKGLKKTLGLWNYNSSRKGDIRCLCYSCLADYKSNSDYIVSRLYPLRSVKDKCDRCNGFGYDYVIVDKRQIH